MPRPAALPVLVFDGATQALMFQFDGDSALAHMGQSVAHIGDVNGDGTADLLFGAPHNDPAGVVDAGSAWLRSGTDGAIILQFDGAATGDWLGYCVASAMDLNADGIDDIVFGAPGASPGGNAHAGSAIAYSSTDGSLLLQWDGTEAGDSLGHSVCGIGDVNVDGYADYMIGAPLAQTAGVYHGSAYLIDGQSGKVLRQEDGSEDFDSMGSAVAGLGDINGLGLELGTGTGLLEVAFAASGVSAGGQPGAGTVIVHGIEPLISADSDSIVTSTGGTVNFFLDFPAESAGHDFRLLGSQTGLGPIFNGGIYIPLTPGDQVWRYMTEPVAPAWFTNSIGVLDANGDANVTMTVPIDEGPYFLGETFYFAAVTYIPPASPLISSVAVKVEFLP